MSHRVRAGSKSETRSPHNIISQPMALPQLLVNVLDFSNAHGVYRAWFLNSWVGTFLANIASLFVVSLKIPNRGRLMVHDRRSGFYQI